MQLGARWRVGDPPHRGVPTELHATIAEQERLHPGSVAWTLTWLEGRPQCTLDDLVRVTPEAITPLHHSPATHAGDAGNGPDDDWLS